MKSNLLSLLCIMFLITSCASKKFKDVSYQEKSETINSQSKPTLNIFQPRNNKFTNNKVLVFVHGGNWNSGNKKLYGFFGRNFAKKGVTTVIVGYTLSPKANYNDMATEVAKAVEWTKENISKYNGNPSEIFLTGHSAGGHLIALIGTNPKYLKDKSIIKGVILNDAAGLDMKNYLEDFPPTLQDDYLTTWSNDPKIWQDASPIYFLDKKSPPFMIYTGGTKTYPSIQKSNDRFLAELNKYQSNVQLNVLNKKHVSMITQYFFPWSKRYNEIVAFIKNN